MLRLRFPLALLCLPARGMGLTVVGWTVRLAILGDRSGRSLLRRVL